MAQVFTQVNQGLFSQSFVPTMSKNIKMYSQVSAVITVLAGSAAVLTGCGSTSSACTGACDTQRTCLTDSGRYSGMCLNDNGVNICCGTQLTSAAIEKTSNTTAATRAALSAPRDTVSTTSSVLLAGLAGAVLGFIATLITMKVRGRPVQPAMLLG
mmetsp:Transcript_12081/g.21274  ORF Transcript_12081/g.21274 Transcript_12081/m.21274 type:complete len:156 (-) Transcript_12081:25-492(-)